MYQDYITGQTEFVLNYDYNVSQTHIVRLIDAFVDSIPQEVLLEENVATTGRLARIRQFYLKFCYLLIPGKPILVVKLRPC